MRTSIVGVIARKILEAFRDRKTLFLMVFLPMLLYPAMLLLVTQVAMLQQEKLTSEPSRVAVLGGAPEHPFEVWLRDSEDFEVVPWLDPDTDPERVTLDARVADAIVDVRDWPADDWLGTATVPVHLRTTDDASRLAADRIEQALTEVSDAELARRLGEAGIDPELVEPISAYTVDHADTIERGGYFLGSLLPIIVIATVLLGAVYPAIDLTAGEKERGTIQTLFTAPVSSVEIVAGKYIAVVTIALVSGMANLLSMALVFGQNLLAVPDLAEELDFSLSAPVMFALLACIVMLALFVSAMLLWVSALAPSFKEAQTYITPVYLLCIVPAMIAQMPGFEYSHVTAMIPAVNVVLLMKEVLLHGPSAEPLFLVGAASLVFSGLMVVGAAHLFAREEIRVGDAGGFALLMPRRSTKPRPRPTIGEGVVWYGMAFLLLFYVGATLQAQKPQLGLVVTLWVLILGGSVAMAWWLRLDLRETFSLRAGPWTALLGALLAGAGASVLVGLGAEWLQDHVLRAPPEVVEQMGREMERFFPRPESAFDWVWLLTLVAVSPAICEEMMFRGFILSSLRGRLPGWAVALLVGVMFGAFHLSVYRLFGTSVLGAVMAWTVLRHRAIGPAMVFHAANNGAAVIVGYTASADLTTASEAYVPALPWAIPAVVVGVALLWFRRGTTAPAPLP